jgi:hypothetical protein
MCLLEYIGEPDRKISHMVWDYDAVEFLIEKITDSSEEYSQGDKA